MAKVKIQGHASGTGILTVTAPDTDVNRTITLPDGTGTLAFTTGDDDKLPLAGGTMTGNIDHDDGVRARYGDDNDLQIFHVDGSNSYIENVGEGDLIIQDIDGDVRIKGKSNEDSIVANNDGSVQLYYDNGIKLATTTTGIDVTGTITADSFSVNSGTTNTSATFTSTDAGAGINLTDSVGTSNIQTNSTDLRIGVDEDAAVDYSTIKFRVDGSTKATIDSSGKVGIGVTPNTSWHADHVAVQLGGGKDGFISAPQGQNIGRMFVGANAHSTTANGSDWSRNGDTYKPTLYSQINGAHKFQTSTAGSGAISWNTAMTIESDGDIIFYDDGGTSEDLFWDASESRLGIGQTSPAAPLDVRATAKTYTIFAKDTDNVCDTNAYSIYIDKNISGSDTCTTDRTHAALYIDVDSSATGGDTTDEHRIYGIYTTIDSTGDSDNLYGSYNRAKAQPSAGTVTNVRAAYNNVIGDPDSGASVTNVYGVQSTAYAQGAGDITTIYGNFNWVNVDSNYTGSNISSANGVVGEVEMDAAGTLDNAYGVQSIIDRNAGTITNGYLFHGDYQGTKPTNAYGVYIADDVDNYFAGNVGIGTDSPDTNLEIEADDNLTTTFPVKIINSAGSGSTQIGAYAIDTTSVDLTLKAGGNTGLTIDKDDGSVTVNGDLATGNITCNQPDNGGSPAMTATINMHGYEGRGVGIKMKDSVNSASGASDREWFVGTGYNYSGFNIAYSSSGSESSYLAQTKLRVSSGGDVQVETGNLVIGTAGKGIDFSAQTSADSPPETNTGDEVLDHYEEGTWTPTLHGYTTSGTETYSQQTGKYTKIGNFVHASFYVLLSDKGNMTGNYTLLTGLPFNHNLANGGSTIISGYGGLTSNTSWVGGDLSSTANFVWLTRGTNSTSHSNMNTSEITDTTSFTGTLVYRI